MTNQALLESIQRRASFLRAHPRIGPWEFARDFIAKHGFGMLQQVERFDGEQAITCDCLSLFGSPGTEAERKALQRGLKALSDAGKIERVGRSSYRLKEPA